MIDRNLNYGIHYIKRFLEMAKPFNTVLDLGTGKGRDLALAQSIQSKAKRIAVEVYPPKCV